MPKLSSDTKAVLRELRRHNRSLEYEVHRLANAVVALEWDVGDRLRSLDVGPTGPREAEG